MGIEATGLDLDIDLKAFKGGYTPLDFDLTPDKTPDDACINLLRQGKVTMSMRFGTALPHQVSFICLLSYDNLIQFTGACHRPCHEHYENWRAETKFAADTGTIPKKNTPLSCFISNTAPQSEPGEHFFMNQNGHTFYSDSCGIPPINIKRLEFCQNCLQGIWTFNRQQLQNLTSSTCGFHCVCFVLDTCPTLNQLTALLAMRLSMTNLTDKTAVSYMLKNERKWTRRDVRAGPTKTSKYTSRSPIRPNRRKKGRQP